MHQKKVSSYRKLITLRNNMKSILVILLFFCSCTPKLPKVNSGIIFSISTTTKTFKADDISFRLLFTNNTKEELRILDKFKPIEAFLSITLENKITGEFLYPIIGAKAAFSNREEFKYINIPPGKRYEKDINLSEILKERNFIIPSGSYNMIVTYGNQYGQNCIQEVIRSNEIEINIIQ